MKKITFLIFIAILSFNSIDAQVLYDENFDNLQLGDLSTDLTGATPGQGGWYTRYQSSTQTGNLKWFQIQNENNKGKVITIQSPPPNLSSPTILQKKNIDLLINNRTPNYNVIKFEFDFHTGNKYTVPNSSSNIYFGLNDDAIPSSIPIAGFNFYPATGELRARFSSGVGQAHAFLNNNQPLILPFNTWIKLTFYLDYNNKAIYYEIPNYNIIVKQDFLKSYNNSDYLIKFIPKNINISTAIDQLQATYKFDNVKITGLNNIPLNVTEFLNGKFNLYPNPATNVVNITNSENMSVKEIEIYDVTGKLINTQSFNNETNIQLNVETLTNGIYLLHLQTNGGTAVKKLIKK